MIIKTDSLENIISGISDALDICEEYLLEWIEEHGFEDDTIFEFVQANYSEDVDCISISHLSRAIKPPTLLLPLDILLTTQNEFSDFLKSNDFSFKKEQDRLTITHKGREWNQSNILTGHLLLERRLGYGSQKDYQICAFLFSFWIEREQNDYYHSLMDGPEFLLTLDRYFGTKLKEKYVAVSEYYLIEATVPIENAYFLFGPEEYASTRDKAVAYLCECIRYVRECKYNGIDLNNPIVELRDITSIAVKSCKALSSLRN